MSDKAKKTDGLHNLGALVPKRGSLPL